MAFLRIWPIAESLVTDYWFCPSPIFPSKLRFPLLSSAKRPDPSGLPPVKFFCPHLSVKIVFNLQLTHPRFAPAVGNRAARDARSLSPSVWRPLSYAARHRHSKGGQQTNAADA